MSITQIMQTDIVTITINKNLKESVNLMHKYHVGSLIVIGSMNGQSRIPKGIITDRDIAITLKDRAELTASTLVKDVMETNVILCREEEGIFKVIHKMKKNGIRRIPVVNKKDQLIGIITADDIYKFLTHELNELSDIITQEVTKEEKSLNKSKNIKGLIKPVL